MIRSVFGALCAYVLLLTQAHLIPYALGADVTPPDITNVQITNVGEHAVTITWDTDEDSDSTVNYGLQEDYGIVRVPVADKKQHSITLGNLESGRTYYFRVVSSDGIGNQGISANYKVVTSGSPQSGADSGQGASNGQGQSQSTSEAQVTQEIIAQVQQIQSPERLQEIVNETIKAIQGVTEDLTIVGPPVVIPETNTALVRWTTDRAADSEVVFSRSDAYVEDTYEFSQKGMDGATTDHEIQLIGLEPYTEYHFKVRSTDSYGITGSSKDYTFRTKASLPNIRNLHIVKVEEDSATLAWDTTVPAKALIEYQDMTTGAKNSVGRPTLASTQQMRITNLTLGTRYVAYVIAENAGGDRVKSQPITFVTVKDTAPPIISNVTNDSTLFPGDESRIQTIIEWLTDEPAHCTLTYREGIAGGVEPTVLDSKNTGYSADHVEVVVDFAPATAYQFWLECTDESGNSVKSENYVLFTPIHERSIIDIIIENFEATFGWIKNVRGTQ